MYSRALAIRVLGQSVEKSMFQVSTRIEEGGESSRSSRDPLELRRHSFEPLENRLGLRVTRRSVASGIIKVGERRGGVKGGDPDDAGDPIGGEPAAFYTTQFRM